MWYLAQAARVMARVGHRGLAQGLGQTASGKKQPSLKYMAVAAATVCGSASIVVTFGEPFETEVEVKEVAPGAEYRVRGVAPRKNNNYPEEPAVLQYVYRARDRIRRYYEDYIAESDVKVLLPAMVPPLYRPNGGKNDYTLVVDLDKTLVYTEFKVSRGFRTIKRPGVDFFLDWASQNFAEVVLFSDSERMDAEPLVTKLDKNFPNGIFTHLLWKGDMRTVDGELVKDVNRLNRNPARVIMLDDDPRFLSAQPENLLQVASFTGDASDTVLVDLIPLLNALISSKKDVRDNLPNWQGLDNPGREFTKINALKWEQRQSQAADPARGMAEPSAPSMPNMQASRPPNNGGYSIWGLRIF